MAQIPNPFERQTPIPGVRHIIAVSSGKGGVGKSTVATNLAVALAKTGAKVGLLDADIYGPSVPRMLGLLHQKPEVGEDRKIQPLSRYGVRLMSIGFLIEEDMAVVWRGPMLFKAMDQFLRDVNWGELDYLLVDLPPGTGDVQLSLAQKVPLAGAITVCTPQNVALNDVKKSLDMFHRINVPILGMIENMAYYQPTAESERVQLFPRGDLNQFLDAKGIRKLAEIPFHPNIGVGSEAGIPQVEGYAHSSEAEVFRNLAIVIREIVP